MQILPLEHDFDEPLGLLSDCHRRIERFLEVLRKVAADSPEDLPLNYRQALKSALDYFEEAAPKHTADEEHSLFPRLAGNPEAARTIRELQADHQRADQLHARVNTICRRWLSEGVLADREQLCQALDSLAELYAEHIQTEDSRLFPLAAELLSYEALAEVGREMAARRQTS